MLYRWILSVTTLWPLLVPGPSASGVQPLQVEVTQEALVAHAPKGTVLVEPHLAVHPSAPGQVLAVAMVYPEGPQSEDPSLERCAVLRSSDAGVSWERSDLEIAFCGDPWVTLTDRLSVLTALGTHPSLPDKARQALAYFSDNGGRDWLGVPQSLGRDHDGPRSVAGRDGSVYVVSGQSWIEDPRRQRFAVLVGRARRERPYFDFVHRLLPSNLNLNADGIAVLSDGTFVLTYDDFGRKVDGRWSFAGALKARRSWAVVSRDGGRTFSTPFFIAETCFSRPSSLAVDPSTGPFKDRLYYACSSDENRSILVSYSSDGGDEWSNATTLEPPAGEKLSRSDPQIAVNRQGVVAVAWMDRRDDSAGRCYAPYIAVSADGGRNFGPPVRIASQPSCPDSARMGYVARRWPTGGDYFGLAADLNGRFLVMWPDARDGVFHLRSAAVNVSAPPRE